MSDAPASSDCLSNHQLRELLEGAAAREPETAEQHLVGCEPCRRRMEQLAGHLTTPPGYDLAAPSSGSLDRVIDELCSVRPDPLRSLGILRKSADANCLAEVGKYQIRGVIGQGGMGVVFDGFDPTLERAVAIKIPLPSLVSDPTVYDRFLREARALASLSHPNIVTVHAVEEVNGTPLMVMERIDGQSLELELATLGCLPFERVLRIAIQTCAALEAAHARDLIHRDIKPANILLEAEGGCVKVTDFGLAKSLSSPSLSTNGLLVGTPEYMSPEQAASGAVTAKSDLFSLGTVLYETLSGKSLFREHNALATLQRVCTYSPPRLGASHVEIPEWFDDLLQQLLLKEPSKRPSSAAHVLETLKARGAASRTREPTKSSRWITVAVTSLALLVLAIGAFATRSKPSATPGTGIPPASFGVSSRRHGVHRLG